MALNKRVTVEKWITEALSDPDKESKCSQLSLVHMVGMQQQEVHTVKIGPGGRNLEPKNLAELFNNKAEVYAQDLQGMQTFVILAFYGTSEPQSRHLFVKNQNVDPSSMAGLGTEPPTNEGKTMQGMRWFETGMQQVFRRQQVLDEFSMRLIETQSRIIENVMHENRDANEIVMRVMREKVLGDQEFKIKTMEFQRATDERKKWLSFGPALVNSIMGREVFPVNTEDTALIETIADEISAEDVEKLSFVLPPTLSGPLMARFKRHAEAKEKAKQDAESKALGVIPAGNPEDDAAGD